MSAVPLSYFVNLSSSLTFFNVYGCMSQGELPPNIFSLPNLLDLNLDYNDFTVSFPKSNWSNNCTLIGSIPSSLVNLTKLTTLDLSRNELTGHIPSFVVKLEQLMYVDLSLNNFTGVLDLGVFSTLKNLQGPLPIPPLPIVYFWATDNHFSGEIPTSICKVSSLESLGLARNNLSSSIPQCLGNLTNLWDLDLSANKFEGTLLRSLDSPLPIPPPTTRFFLSANNKIGGKVSPLICNATELKVLDLSNNSLMGTLLECLMSFSKNLSVLNLRMNMIHGMIPRTFAEDNKLRTIDLSRNRFEGTLPRSLLHCEKLEVLDLGNNRMKDTFPDWLGTLPKLQVLVLRSNMFHGFMSSPREARSFFELHIFDLSNNNLSGPLPVSYIMKLIAMMYQDKRQGKPQYMGDGNYQDSVMVTMKGLEIRLVKIVIVFTSIDLLSNHFGGELPVYIGNLKSLKGLNFSHNNLTGYIPLSTGNLTELEWLDLSLNKFIGSIPQELADLTHGGWFEWRAILMGYGCGTVGGVSLGYIVLGSRKFEWLAGLLERKGANMRKKWRRNARRSYQI
ncbi:hypothetical protein EUGRSUZ_F00511 [Eucalyptus grandis]|uniref:Uncharacterized protein n=2 Tax=Eucalyptus grandis TaxID=71139 RepID=A0ACC3KBK8_EUCGR|nr:hypothetical protein EUGRSUZ_F00511 [Eucalyptus grandis]